MSMSKITRPSAREVAERFVVLKYHVVYALTAPPRKLLSESMTRWTLDERGAFAKTAELERDKYWGKVKNLGIWDKLSPSEKDFAATTIVTMTSAQQVQASWRMEAAAVVLWALNLVDSLPPFDTEASHDLLKHFPDRSISDFFASATLRSSDLIEELRNVAELWHWRSRTRKLEERGEVFPVDETARQLGLQSFDDIVRFTAKKAYHDGTLDHNADEDLVAFDKPYRSLTPQEWSAVNSITMERHFALNWLCGYAAGNCWDETPTDT